MTALVAVKVSLYRLPARIPDSIPVSVLYIEILTVIVIRDIVVSIPCKAEKLSVLIEGVASAGVRDQ